MAIDLATTLSPYRYKNMLPLDILASVASETLRNEINPSDNVEINMANTAKRQIKKSTTSVLTFDDVKRMPAKSLIDKFSEMTSDELTKKYFYKCILLPKKCNVTFKSFGNEKKACDKMKVHLMCHIQQLTKEFEEREDKSDMIFIPKSPTSNSKHSEKLSRKSLKKQPISFNSALSRSSPKASKKLKTSTFSLKAVRKKLIEKNKYFPSLKNGLSKMKGKSINSVYLKENPSIKQHSGDSFIFTDNKIFHNKKPKCEIPENFDPECDNEHYSSSYSKHLRSAFFTDVEVKEDLSESPYESEGSEEISQTNDSDNSGREENKLFLNKNPSSDKSFIFLHDHNYVSLDESSKSDKIIASDVKIVVKEDPFKSLTTEELPPYVVKTPPFPFIHTPILPEVAGIIEITMDSSSDADNYPQSNYSYAQSSKSESEDASTDESASDHEEKYSDGILYKMNCLNNSVLTASCVDNIENKKHSSLCVPKSEISASENDENLENLQKDEKELALKYIAKLHSKGKKKFTDSLICQICPDKHFTAQATLIHHYRSHAGIKPYICKLCSAKFTRQHSLNYHMLIHQNLSRFSCDFCGRTFRHPSHYKEHLRRHTGETPYHCTDCNLHFKTRNTFKRHLKTRHGKLLTAGGIEDLNPE